MSEKHLSSVANPACGALEEKHRGKPEKAAYAAFSTGLPF
jgi:hypothetical protein